MLSQEVPTVQLHTEPYERVTLQIHTVTEQQQITASLVHERAEVLTTTPAGSRPHLGQAGA